MQGVLQTQLLPEYFQALQNSKTVQDLASTVKLHFNKAIDLVMPDHILIIKPLKVPQDILEQEESKAEFDLTTALIRECDNFQESNQVRCISLETELLERREC